MCEKKSDKIRLHNVTNSLVPERIVDLATGIGGLGAAEANSVEDDGRVEAETVEGDVEGEP